MKGCLKCETIFDEEEYVCPDCRDEHVISMELALFLAKEYLKEKQLDQDEIQELEDEM